MRCLIVSRAFHLSMVSAVLWTAADIPVEAQQVMTTGPATGVSHGYYEAWGTNWGFRHQGPNGYVFFNNGGYGAAAPPFGGSPGGASLGWSAGNRDSRFWYQMFGAQGSSSSVISQTPSLTVMNGGSGFLFDGVVRPWATGWVPVVGQQVWQPGPVGWVGPPTPARAGAQQIRRWSPEDELTPPPAPQAPARNHDDPPLILRQSTAGARP